MRIAMNAVRPTKILDLNKLNLLKDLLMLKAKAVEHCVSTFNYAISYCLIF